jgi:hypothetical protein
MLLLWDGDGNPPANIDAYVCGFDKRRTRAYRNSNWINAKGSWIVVWDGCSIVKNTLGRQRYIRRSIVAAPPTGPELDRGGSTPLAVGERLAETHFKEFTVSGSGFVTVIVQVRVVEWIAIGASTFSKKVNSAVQISNRITNGPAEAVG